MLQPTFIVIGAAKSGTTSLRGYLGQHPEIFIPARGEPSFFAHEGEVLDFKGPGDDEWRFVTKLAEYEKLFVGADGYGAVGEISPRYLFFERSCERIKRHVPEVRLIAILRHPVDRAYSHFLMNRGRCCEPEADFEIALAKEEERAELGWGWDWQYVGAGRYYEQLSRYFGIFDRERIKVFLYDDYRSAADTFFEEMFSFLGVDPSFRPDTALRHRQATLPRIYWVQRLTRRKNMLRAIGKKFIPATLASRGASYVAAWNKVRPKPLSPPTRHRLFVEYFRQDCLRLESLIHRDLTRWIGCADQGAR